MKKIAVLAAVVLVAAVAAPALSATNPFMDVPLNHWAYDAIGQLAAHGILSGYPDGLYKGKQATTRYEMASALARALAVVDMTKASKQDVEMLKRLVVEFKDELEALGVRVDELDERVAILEDRLGGWKISGTLALQATYHGMYDDVVDSGTDQEFEKVTFDYDEAKLIFDRWWGANDEYHFQARFRGDDTAQSNNATLDRFFVEMPFFMDTRLTIGRFSWAFEGAYKIDLPSIGGWNGDQPMTDWRWDGFGLTKNFAIGDVKLAIAHPDNFNGAGRLPGERASKYDVIRGNTITEYDVNSPLLDDWNTWMILFGANLQFTERIGLDLGALAFVGDNAEVWSGTNANNNAVHQYGDLAFKNWWTVWAGLRFNFTDAIALKGIFYHQKWDVERAGTINKDGVNTGIPGWYDYGDDANHWAVMFDIAQDALKFTSVWVEYGRYDAGFRTRGGTTIDYGGDLFGNGGLPWDIKYWRVGLGQEWNEKFATHLFYYSYDVDGRNWKPKEFGGGIRYKLNDSTTMGLNYMRVNMDDMFKNDDIVRFRTLITF